METGPREKISPHVLVAVVLAVAIIAGYVTFMLSYCGSLVCSISSVLHVPLPIEPLQNAAKHLQIGDTTIAVELATTPAEQELGLGNRASLDPQTGMWFVFAAPAYEEMWMKDMHFALDMIWVDQNMRIIYIATDVTPASYPQIYEPSSPALYVLEVNAGFAAAHGVAIGQTVTLE